MRGSLLTNFWLVPLAQASWRNGGFAAKLRWASKLAIVEKAKYLSAIGTVTLASVMALLWALSLVGDANSALFKEAIEAVRRLQRTVEQFAYQYAQFGLWLGLGAGSVALFFAAKAARRKLLRLWKADAERLRAHLESDQAAREALRRVPELRLRVDRLAALESALLEPSISQGKAAQLRHARALLLNELAAEESRRTLDVERTLRASASKGGSSPESRGKLRAWAKVVVSPRLSKDLGLVGKSMASLLTAMQFVALIGWTAVPFADTLRVTLNDLRVGALRHELNGALDEAIAREAPCDDCEVDQALVEQAARYIAQAAVYQLQNSAALRGPETEAREPRPHTEFVRSAIRGQSLATDAERTDAQDLRREFASDWSARRSSDRGVTAEAVVAQLAGRLQGVLNETYKAGPGTIERLTNRAVARYGRFSDPVDVHAGLTTRAVAAAFSLAGVETGGLDRFGVTLATEAGKGLFAELAFLNGKAIILDGLLARDSKAEVIRHLKRRFPVDLSPPTEDRMAELNALQGTGWEPTPAEKASERMYTSVSREAYKRSRTPSDPGRPPPPAGYSGVFPPSEAWTRSFEKSARSPWARGVIMGRELSVGFSVTDIDWDVQTRPGEVTLITLRLTIDGRDQTLGPFAAGVANQALRFAAEQRTVATTITSGCGTAIRRVTYLHPSLEDTPLGCRIVEVDRVIDTFTIETPFLDPELELVAEGLTQVASRRAAIRRFLALSTVAEEVVMAGDSCAAASPPPTDGDSTAPSLIDEHQRAMVSEMLDGLDADQASTAFLDMALRCGVRRPGAFSGCVCEAARDFDPSRLYWLPIDHTSQIREGEAVGEMSASELLHPEGLADVLEAWLHTTFGVRKLGDTCGDAQEPMSREFPPDEIELLNERLIPDGVGVYGERALQEEERSEFLRPLEEFVVLQRFMRAALDGVLGDGFPIAKLVDLERATAEFVPSQRTVRWEPANQEELDAVLAGGEDARAAFDGWRQDVRWRTNESLPLCAAISN